MSVLNSMGPQPTGGLIVTFRRDADKARRRRVMRNAAGRRVREIMAQETAQADEDTATDAVLLEDSGIAFVAAHADTIATRQALLADDAVAEARPEYWMFAIDQSTEQASYQDTDAATWGIQAVGADMSPYDGSDVALAVLDTGLDARHPDFLGRQVTRRSFVPGELVRDGQGHGTHCAGTAGGHGSDFDGVPRYGVAPGVDLHVGKVLSNEGSGAERWILSGMFWAIRENCAVISMSLGRPTQFGEGPSASYEQLGALALARNSLIIAAAGNESSREFGFIAPVGAPANSPSIMAVAAVDPALNVAEFSCGGVNGEGGEVNIAAPGVGVFSSVPRPRLYAKFPGTSMACPHVAGVAAQWAQTDPDLRGQALWNRLVETARPLPLQARDVGAGLAQCPQTTAKS